MRELFVGCCLVLPFVLFAVLAALQQRRFARLAAELGGRHVRTHIFAPGAIEGADFRIEVVRRGKGHGTRVWVAVRESPGTFLVRAAFFDGTTEEHVFVPGQRIERVFLWELQIGGLVPPDRTQRRALLAWLPPSTSFAELRAALHEARVAELELDCDNLATSFRGIVSNPARLRRTLAALRAVGAGHAGRGARVA